MVQAPPQDKKMVARISRSTIDIEDGILKLGELELDFLLTALKTESHRSDPYFYLEEYLEREKIKQSVPPAPEAKT